MRTAFGLFVLLSKLIQNLKRFRRV
jgi:hypothetical protein